MSHFARRLLAAALVVTLVFVPGVLLAQLDPERLGGLKARNIGPAGMSGRTTVIDVAMSNPTLVYVGTASGGVWKSTSGAVTWTPVFDDQPVHSIGSLAIFQPDPSIVWVGTGEGNLRNSASIGNGVYRTRDGGKTWTHLGLDKTEHIPRIVPHPDNADVAYACAVGQEWGENPDRGVFRTRDGGKTWDKVLYVDEKTGCGELTMDPSNPRKLFAGMWQFRRWPWYMRSGGPSSGMYVTVDGGDTWKRLQEEDGLPKGDLGRMGIAISRSNPDIVYALIEAEKSALVRSDDGGRTWKTVNDSPNVAPRPFYFADIRVDPAWPNRVYSLDYGVRLSEDGGKTFSLLKASRFVHGDNHALWIDPNDPRRMFLGDDGGISESRDRGETSRFVSNLPLAQFYHVAVDNERPYNVFGGLQDNGSWRGPSAVWQNGGIRNYRWEVVGGGDGFDVQPDPKDSTQGYSTWQGGFVQRFNTRTGELKIIKPAPPSADVKLRFNWNTALAVDPFDPTTVYVGSQFVHRSSDRGETWTVISPDLTTNDGEKQKQHESGGLTLDVSSAENYTSLLSIAPSAVERGVIWTGSDDGRIHVSRDGGKTWTSVEGNVKGVPVNTWIPHIEPSPVAGGTAFVVFDNHRRSDFAAYVVRTDDYGKTWRNLPTKDVRGYALAIRQDKVKPDLLFLGTEFGLHASFDGGQRWTALKKTVPTASVMDLAIHPRDNDLVIATHGRAVWILDDITPLRALTEASLKEPLKLYPIGDVQQYWQKAEDGGFGWGASEFRGQNRPYGALLTYSLDAPGLPLQDDDKERDRKEAERKEGRAASAAKVAKEAEGAKAAESPKVAESGKEAESAKDEKPEVQIRVTDATGRLVRRFKAPARLGVNRVAWDLLSDPYKQPPSGDNVSPFDPGEPTGPEVGPGPYTISMTFGTSEASQKVNVMADPRSRNTPEDWQRRADTLAKAGALNDRVVAAIWRIRDARADIDAVQKKAREAAARAGEKDKKKIEELPMVKDGEKVKEGLTTLEKRLWAPPETKGFTAGEEVLNAVNLPLFFILSSWDAPNQNHLDHLRLGEEKVKAILPEVDKYFGADVAGYTAKVREAGIGLLSGR